jgi:hypothetical protein
MNSLIAGLLASTIKAIIAIMSAALNWNLGKIVFP